MRMHFAGVLRRERRELQHVQRPGRAIARAAEGSLRRGAVAPERGPRVGVDHAVLHEAGGAATRERLAEKRAVGDAPLRRAASSEVAVRFDVSVDARAWIVAEARRVEARKRELGGEAQRLAEVNA